MLKYSKFDLACRVLPVKDGLLGTSVYTQLEQLSLKCPNDTKCKKFHCFGIPEYNAFEIFTLHHCLLL